MTDPAESNPEGYAQLLRAARTAEGWTQVKTAEKLQINRTTYCNAENGRATPGVFLRIGNVFPKDAEAILAAWKLEQRQRQAPQEQPSDEDMFDRAGRRRELSGVWHALWETTVEAQKVFNTEVLSAEWKRSRLMVSNEEPSPENPRGGYRWRGELDFIDNTYLLGTYQPTDLEVASRGTMFGVLHRSGKSIKGIWVGCNYDSDLMQGHFVFAKARDDLAQVMKREFGFDVLLP